MMQRLRPFMTIDQSEEDYAVPCLSRASNPKKRPENFPEKEGGKRALSYLASLGLKSMVKKSKEEVLSKRVHVGVL